MDSKHKLADAARAGGRYGGDPGRARRPRWALLTGIVLFHVLAIVGLARAFAPDFTTMVIDRAESLVTVSVTAPDEPADLPAAAVEPQPDAGAAGEVGKQAKPREVAAPRPKVKLTPQPPAPPAASTGDENLSGTQDRGAGSGAGGTGDGAGSGGAGDGQGNAGRKAEKIAGDINSARDYPIPAGGREARVGKAVDIAIRVGADGLPKACRILRSSGLPETDQVTCRLAVQRFRFKPALDANGNPVASEFGWRQRFFF